MYACRVLAAELASPAAPCGRPRSVVAIAIVLARSCQAVEVDCSLILRDEKVDPDESGRGSRLGRPAEDEDEDVGGAGESEQGRGEGILQAVAGSPPRDLAVLR